MSNRRAAGVRRPTPSAMALGLPPAPQAREAAASILKPNRRTQAERTGATRKKLIDAAISVMRLRGYGGLTTTEVADVAGVSRGALLHHFPTRHDLVVATMRYMNDLILVESRRRAAVAAAGAADPIAGVIRDAKDFFFSDFFFVSLAIGMGDAHEEDLRRQTQPLSRDSRFAVERAWLDALITRGIDKAIAARILALTLSLVRGFSIRVFIDDDRKHFDQLLETWTDMVRVYLASDRSARVTAGRKSGVKPAGGRRKKPSRSPA